MSHVILYVTAPTMDEAETIAGKLVEEKLAACANVSRGVRSFYRWQGKLQSDAEVSFILKTKKSLIAKATERIEELHSYDCPCVIALPIVGGSEAFLRWIDEETV